MSEEFQLKNEMPLDADGFLRRACPGCGREFKWVASEPGEGEPEPEGGWFCPYCCHRGEDWLTTDQADYATAKAGEAAVEKLLGGRGPFGGSGFVKIEIDAGPGVPNLPREPNDMQRVDTACHPAEPIKVVDGWSGPLHCLVCSARIEKDRLACPI
jgi:hypothetical protein